MNRHYWYMTGKGDRPILADMSINELLDELYSIWTHLDITEDDWEYRGQLFQAIGDIRVEIVNRVEGRTLAQSKRTDGLFEAVRESLIDFVEEELRSLREFVAPVVIERKED
jgi:hypothetical protein